MTDRERREQSTGETAADLRQYWNDRAVGGQNDNERVEFSRRSQGMRFDAFLLTNDLTDRSVLDIGCGVGDFWEHLSRRKVRCDYYGIDLSFEMVNRSRARFPQVPFDVRDVLECDPRRTYDYAVAFGIHNIRVTGAADYFNRTMRRQFDICTRAAHISVLTDRYAGFAEHIQPWRAEEVLTWALAITPYVVLRHDYLPNDFSVTLYRQPLIDTRSDLVLSD